MNQDFFSQRQRPHNALLKETSMESNGKVSPMAISFEVNTHIRAGNPQYKRFVEKSLGEEHIRKKLRLIEKKLLSPSKHLMGDSNHHIKGISTSFDRQSFLKDSKTV